MLCACCLPDTQHNAPFILNGSVGEDRPPNNRSVIPESLRAVYAEVVAKAAELRRLGLTHPQVCDELNRLGFRTRTGMPWRHAAQIVKLLRSFGSEG